MTTKYHQLSLSETFSDCQNQFIDDSPSFFTLLAEYIELDEFIPPEFYTAFYRSPNRFFMPLLAMGILPFCFYSSKDFFHPNRCFASFIP